MSRKRYREPLSGFRAGFHAVIASAVEDGFVAKMPPTLEPHAQRLLASLRLPVLFVDGQPEPDLERLAAAATATAAANDLLADARRVLGPPPMIWERALELLADGKPRTIAEVHRQLGCQYEQLHKELRRLVAAGFLVKPRRGVYLSANHEKGAP